MSFYGFEKRILKPGTASCSIGYKFPTPPILAFLESFQFLPLGLSWHRNTSLAYQLALSLFCSVD